MKRVLWRSWTPEWSAFEVERLQSLGLNWHDGHKLYPLSDDIWLTVNGQNCPHPEWLPESCVKATFYCETYQYLQTEYDAFPNDTKWDVRFTYNPDLLKYLNTRLITLPGYWAMDGKPRMETVRDKTFGMVLTKKFQKLSPCDLGPKRTEFVEALKGKSFVYWGQYWDMQSYGEFYPSEAIDPNYQGTSFKAFDKHFETRELFSRCKFGLSLDTSEVNGFVTEKFWQVLAAGCVPVYLGPESIRAEVPSEVYINARDFPSIPDVICDCEGMSDAEWKRRSDAGYEFFLADKEHSWESAFTKIDTHLQML
jgi:hypothetical protein